MEAFGGDAPHAHQKRAGAGAACEPGGFRVEKGPLLRWNVADCPVRQGFQQISGQLRQFA